MLVGSEGSCVSPNEINYRVVWNTDKNGQLVASDTLEDEPRIVTVVPPADVTTRIVSIEVEGRYYNVSVPDEVGPCSGFQSTVQVHKQEASREDVIGDFTMSHTQVAQRINSLLIQSLLRHVITLTKTTGHKQARVCERYWTARMIFVMRKHTYNMKQNYND